MDVAMGQHLEPIRARASPLPQLVQKGDVALIFRGPRIEPVHMHSGCTILPLTGTLRIHLVPHNGGHVAQTHVGAAREIRRQRVVVRGEQQPAAHLSAQVLQDSMCYGVPVTHKGLIQLDCLWACYTFPIH
jgi:hypothetical protein